MTMAADSPLVVWCGRFYTHDGYGSAARLHVAALRSQGVPVLAIDSESREIVGPVHDNLVTITQTDKQLTVRAVDPDRRITAIVHDRPDLYSLVAATGRARLVGYSYCETTTLPANWASSMSSMDGIVTSSDFNRKSFIDSGVPPWMIDIVGHPADPLLAEVARSKESHRERWPEATVFLSVAAKALGRRDLSMLFEAYAMAFNAEDDVALVLKVPPNALDQVTETIERVKSTMPARPPEDYPTVHLVASKLTREQMVRLHASVDVYVSSERGDGWDLPAMDSMLLGIPVIATDFGASAMFLRDDDCYLVETSESLVGCDDVLLEPHPLYSGQSWPYVDPTLMGQQLRRAATDPVERRSRGDAAQIRMRSAYAPATVATQVCDLVADATEVDYRSNAPAVVTISADANSWRSEKRYYPLLKLPVAGELRLLAPLVTDGFLNSQNPVDILRSYKIASQAVAADPTASGTNTHAAISDVMAKSSSQPQAKLRAIHEFRSVVRSEAAKYGGVESVAELAETILDYEQCLDGQKSMFTAAEAEARRRPLWGKHGPFVSPGPDLERLGSLRNQHLGERVFILGNGPSLTKCDLGKLENEYTFGVNKIYLLFDQINWRPDYYTLLDWKMGAGIQNELHQLDGITKFFPERFRGVLPPDDDTYWYWPRVVGTHIGEQFEPNMVHGLPSRATVLVTAIQQAFHLGFREIYLIGTDASYTIPSSVIQTGRDVFRTGVKLNLESTQDDDPNHFAPTYFGKGTHWHDPNVSDMRRLFRIMRKGVERYGGKLINASVGGELEELDRVDFDSLF